jgi:hypothetical protein
MESSEGDFNRAAFMAQARVIEKLQGEVLEMKKRLGGMETKVDRIPAVESGMNRLNTVMEEVVVPTLNQLAGKSTGEPSKSD